MNFEMNREDIGHGRKQPLFSWIANHPVFDNAHLRIDLKYELESNS